ncbi:hypothetical protein SADUNF_Sadunf02G0094400 [Salix dunnii]|uniref:Uncharacterized protein n=1 Tax=Salix dunnii TaxID=1413687 RepID=A0A835N6X8_9ROSI|nr:hypothetical protein SADUNF_Sadunf02G0094400 [Salix dunnii]
MTPGTSDAVFGIASGPQPGLERAYFPFSCGRRRLYANASLQKWVLDNFTSDILEGMSEQQVEEFDPPEFNFLSMRAHAERFGMPSPPQRIIAAGGASADQSILNL